MIRTLLIIAGAALVLAIVTLGGAVAVGGQDLVRNGWAWTLREDGGDTVRFERKYGPREPDVTRRLEWTGSDTLTIDLPADVTYVQGAETGVVITGSRALTERVVLDGGRLSLSGGDDRSETVTFGWDNGHGWAESDDLSIVVTAPSVIAFTVLGSSDLDIQSYDQPRLTVDLTGSGDVRGSGRTEALTVTLTGSGDIDLETLAATTAWVDLDGSGDVTVAPRDAVEVTLNGSGDVNLTTRPAQIASRISGSGELRQD